MMCAAVITAISVGVFGGLLMLWQGWEPVNLRSGGLVTGAAVFILLPAIAALVAVVVLL